MDHSASILATLQDCFQSQSFNLPVFWLLVYCQMLSHRRMTSRFRYGEKCHGLHVHTGRFGKISEHCSREDKVWLVCMSGSWRLTPFSVWLPCIQSHTSAVQPPFQPGFVVISCFSCYWPTQCVRHLSQDLFCTKTFYVGQSTCSLASKVCSARWV